MYELMASHRDLWLVLKLGQILQVVVGRFIIINWLSFVCHYMQSSKILGMFQQDLCNASVQWYIKHV